MNGLYRSLFERARDGLLIVDAATGVIANVNARVTEMLGYPREALVGTALWQVTPCRSLTEGSSMFEQLQRDRLLDAAHVSLKAADGRLIEAQVLSDLCEWDGRQVMHCAVLDLPDRRQVEAQAQEAERHILAMANSMSQLAWIADPDGSIYWYNQRWFEYTGTTPEEMAGWGWQGVHDPEWLPHVMSKWTDSISRREPFEMSFPLRGVDGRFRTFLTRAVPLKDATGQLVQWFGTNTDVDDLSRVQDSLRRSEASLAAAQTRANIGSWEIDLATQEVVCSAQLWRILGRDPAAQRRYVLDFVELHPDDLRTFADKYAHAVAEGSGLAQEARVVRPDGSIRWIEILGEVETDEHGRPLRMVGTSQDITTRKRMDAEMHQLHAELENRVTERTAQLESAVKELETFSYSVSHDLRAPLRAINGFAAIVLEDYGSALPDDGKRQLRRICHGGEQMGRLIDDLLRFSRLTRQPITRRQVDTGTLVHTLLQDLYPDGHHPDLQIIVGALPPCYGDPSLLRQVWINLVSNAIKYSLGRTPAVVEIGCRREAEDVFFVQDNGAGFDMKYAHKLFRVFQRLHRPDEFEGTGVGLAIVHRVVLRHGGRVWAEGEEHRGATFLFTLATEGVA